MNLITHTTALHIANIFEADSVFINRFIHCIEQTVSSNSFGPVMGKGQL
jgi:hypothetical protein